MLLRPLTSPAHTLTECHQDMDTLSRGLVRLGDNQWLAQGRTQNPAVWLSSWLHSTFNDNMSVAWNQLWWEYLYHQNWQIPQTRASLPIAQELVVKHTSTPLGSATSWEYCASVKNSVDLRPALKWREQGASQHDLCCVFSQSNR